MQKESISNTHFVVVVLGINRRIVALFISLARLVGAAPLLRLCNAHVHVGVLVKHICDRGEHPPLDHCAHHRHDNDRCQVAVERRRYCRDPTGFHLVDQHTIVREPGKHCAEAFHHQEAAIDRRRDDQSVVEPCETEHKANKSQGPTRGPEDCRAHVDVKE